MKSRTMLLLVVLAAVPLGLVLYAVAYDVFLEVTYPVGGEELQAGEWHTLTWEDVNPDPPDSVEIRVVVPDPFGYILGPLTVSNKDSREHRWFIPEDTDEPSCIFGVEYLDRTHHDESDSSFSIVP